MKIGSILFIALWCTFISLSAQTQLTTGSPQSVNMSADHLNFMDAVIQEYIENEWIPGGVFLVARRGKIVYFKSFGDKSDKRGDTYQNDDIFRIASMTKAVTTVSIMQLYEQGKLRLDDPVSDFIPAFKDMTVLESVDSLDSTYTAVEAEKPITIRHLLTHTSGITYGYEADLSKVYTKAGLPRAGLSSKDWSSERFINELATLPLAFHPGEKYSYGLNMDVLGRVVEVISGQSLSDYFRKNIFDPLEMNDTWFYLPKNIQDRLVDVNQQQEAGFKIMDGDAYSGPDHQYPLSEDHPFYAGGGGLSSTAMDYAKFIHTLLGGGSYGDTRILGKKTIEVMTADQMILLNEQGKGYSKTPGITYCLGFSLTTEKGGGQGPKSPGTYGWGGYFNTNFYIDPREELIFVGMTQIEFSKKGGLWDRLAAVIYGSMND
ncbi:MAG: serine hydrolase domain-containing protein [Cyclobacteriaceae bacterium]